MSLVSAEPKILPNGDAVRWSPSRLLSLVWSPQRRSPAAVIVLGLAVWLWCLHAGIVFTDWSRIVLAIAALSVVVAFYSFVRVRPALSEALLYTLLWVAFSAFGACATYLAASLALPLHDDAFVAADRMLGFDWLAWAHLLKSHAWLQSGLAVIYRTLSVQIILSVILLSFRRVAGRNEELLLGAIVSLVITTFFFAVFPSLGPLAYFHYDGASADTAAYLPQLSSIRAGASNSYAMTQIQGIIPFPSYHVVLAILFAYSQRSNPWTFALFATINTLMLPSIPTEGSHYLADMIAGAAIAGFTILLLCYVARRSAAPAVA